MTLYSEIHIHEIPHPDYRNNYVTPTYDGYPTYYQHYQPIQSPASYQGNYVIQTSQNSPISADGDDGQSSLSHTARTSPETLVWLSENYEPCEGSSLPRCTLYSHYRKHCDESGIDPVNPASFGKLIRSVFRGLKTRRLGTRGNSKYHYYGIRIKPTSAYINEMDIDTVTTSTRNVQHQRQQRRSELNSNPYNTRASANSNSNISITNIPVQNSNNNPRTMNSHDQEYNINDTTNTTNDTYINNKIIELESYTEMMGPVQVPTITVPGFENVEPYLITEDLELSNVHHFIKIYINSWVETIHIAERMELYLIKDNWIKFWNCNYPGLNLIQNQIYKIINHIDISKFIDNIDQLFYQALLDMLMPNVLNTTKNYTNYVTKLRDFATTIVQNIIDSLKFAPIEFIKQKIITSKAFAMRLKRYTYIQHLADACKSVLKDNKQIIPMYDDFKKLDFISIQEQSGWICECDKILVQSVFKSFEENLYLKKKLEEWAEWMEAFIDQTLAKYHDKTLNIQIEKSKNLILIWSYFGSAIIRQLTLKSAFSFGSFHILKIFLDDYISLLIEQRLSKIANTPIVCILSKNWIGNNNYDYNYDIDEQLLLNTTTTNNNNNNNNNIQQQNQDKTIITSTTSSSSTTTTTTHEHEQEWIPNTTIQYVVSSSDTKYVFSNNNDDINNAYVMVTNEQYHQPHHHHHHHHHQQLETIVYIDEHGQQTTPDNSQTQYIVMTGPSSTQTTTIHSNNTDTCSRQNSIEANNNDKQTADDLVLSGDILEADIDSPCKN